jgi:hypothetical protein
MKLFRDAEARASAGIDRDLPERVESSCCNTNAKAALKSAISSILH